MAMDNHDYSEISTLGNTLFLVSRKPLGFVCPLVKVPNGIKESPKLKTSLS